MARDSTWLSKLKSQISHKLRNPATKLTKSSKSTNVGILAFEIAGILSKLLALYQSVSDDNIVRLKNEAVALDGVRKIVSNDESFLLGLACAEMVQNLHVISKSVARLSSRCSDLGLQSFPESLEDFASTGRDLNNWSALCAKDVEGMIRRADRYITATSALFREMEELNVLQHNLKKTPQESVLDVQQKIVWQKQEIKRVKEKALWSKNYDSVVLILARMIFTVLARVKFVFGIENNYHAHPSTLPRSLSTSSAMVFPSSDHNLSVSGSMNMASQANPNRKSKNLSFATEPNKIEYTNNGFFETRTKDFVTPPQTTLGAAALSLHYANLIIVLEKMIKSPHLVGLDAREDVYTMLPNSIRSSLRARLRGVGFSATDPNLAGEWRDALGRILAWLGPLAHNMIKWQSERSFEQQNLMPKSTNVMLLQTLYFANKDKTEAAITELLVGLNYIWRFEREMNAKALLECSNYFFNSNNKNIVQVQP
ncbi:protein PSK SIMULATOR 3-like [Silene latifolia]|uniref:protein PSK SIMULATOR 3-like n=1 Tax=Silene latifolia TaxID=37657 RepID=UPI003D76A5BC